MLNSSVKAKVVRWKQEPCLIASFRKSEPPMVWQMDLAKLTDYSLRLVEKEGEWDLGYTDPTGAFTLVAHFEERDEGEKAYNAVERALIVGAANDGAGGRRTDWLRVLLMIVGFLFLTILALNFVTGTITGRYNMNEEKTAEVMPPQTGGATRQEPQVLIREEQKFQNGVPANADDVLRSVE